MDARRAVSGVATVAMVVALVIGAAWLMRLNRGGPEPSADSVTAAAPGATVEGPSLDDAQVTLDLGAVSETALAMCQGSPDATVLFSSRQATDTSPADVMVVRDPDGEVRLCDGFGGDVPAEAPLPVATEANPVVFLANGRSSWSCQGTDRVLERFRQSTWLAVAPEVDTVAERIFVDGVPGPWFTTTASGGYAHLQAWLVGPQPASTTYEVEYRVLDADGTVVRQSALPSDRAPLTGCTAEGSAEIG